MHAVPRCYPHTTARALALATGRGFARLAAAFVVAMAAGCAVTPPPQAFDAWSEGFAADWVRLSPERATFSQFFRGAEQDALDSQLSPLTAERRERERTLARQGLTMLDRYLAGSLSHDQRTAALTMQWSLQRSLAGAEFEDLAFPFNQLNGLQVRSVNLLTQSHPLRRPTDVQSYLSRLSQLPARVDEAIARSRASAARGVLPPRFILERGRGQLEAFLQAAPSDNLFVTALASRTERMAELSVQDRSLALQRAQTLVADGVRPAFERALALLNELHPRTTNDAGLWRLPGGDRAYAQALAANTTTKMTAEEIHTVGLREVARIEGEMDRVLKTLGRSQGSVRERMAAGIGNSKALGNDQDGPSTA
jgi:uncharacterized protein (DUF885 family)